MKGIEYSQFRNVTKEKRWSISNKSGRIKSRQMVENSATHFFTHVQHSIDVKAVSACTFITSETATDSRHRSFCHASTWQIRLDPLSRTPRGRQIKRLRRSRTAVFLENELFPETNVWPELVYAAGNEFKSSRILFRLK